MSVLSWNAGVLKSDKLKITLLPAAICIVTEIQLKTGEKHSFSGFSLAIYRASSL
jgi:hypothetical protein